VRGEEGPRYRRVSEKGSRTLTAEFVKVTSGPVKSPGPGIKNTTRGHWTFDGEKLNRGEGGISI